MSRPVSHITSTLLPQDGRPLSRASNAVRLVLDDELVIGDRGPRSIRYQQPKYCFQAKASLADERRRLQFRALVRIRPRKSHGMVAMCPANGRTLTVGVCSREVTSPFHLPSEH
jgi:hypothetical protein